MGLLNPCQAKVGRGFFYLHVSGKAVIFVHWFFGVYFARSAVCGSGFFISAIPPKSRELKPCWHPVFYSIKKYVSKGIAN